MFVFHIFYDNCNDNCDNSNTSIKEVVFMINTVIIQPQKQDRDKIASLLSAQADIRVLACGKDAYDALKLISNLKPDIAVMDNYLEFIEGDEIPLLLKARSPLTAVIILASRISDSQFYRAACGEVSGFVYKETDVDFLPKILKCVAEGGCYISPLFAARILHLLSGRQPDEANFSSREDPLEYLSKMELQVLTYIGEGYASREIAKNLNLAVGTVRNYISSVMRKTGLNNRLQMARYALYYGLAPLKTFR